MGLVSLIIMPPRSSKPTVTAAAPPLDAAAEAPITVSSARGKRRTSVKRDFDMVMSGKRLAGKARPFLCIPRSTFRRLVEEIASEMKSDLRLRQDALDTVQEDAEMLIIERFKRCARLAEICRKDTVRSEHWNYVREDEGGVALPYSGRS